MDILNALIDRRYALEDMKEIPDMKAYADEWSKLAADFEAVGFASNAAMCWSKATHYRSQVQGSYQRVIETPNYVKLQLLNSELEA